MRLKRVFDIDIETCVECGGDVKIIASIEDPAVIQKILAHLDEYATTEDFSVVRQEGSRQVNRQLKVTPYRRTWLSCQK